MGKESPISKSDIYRDVAKSLDATASKIVDLYLGIKDDDLIPSYLYGLILCKVSDGTLTENEAEKLYIRLVPSPTERLEVEKNARAMYASFKELN